MNGPRNAPLLALLLLLAACTTEVGADAAVEQSAASAQASDLPVGTHHVQGRTVVFRLPYRSAQGQTWVAGTDSPEDAPFTFQNLDVEPGAGPGGTDMAVYIYQADRAGSATLTFGLVPTGKTLIGPHDTRVDPASIPIYTATVTVQ